MQQRWAVQAVDEIMAAAESCLADLRVSNAYDWHAGYGCGVTEGSSRRLARRAIGLALEF